MEKQLTTEQKLDVRNAQFAVITAMENVKRKQEDFVKLVEGMAKSLGITEAGFNLETLEFTQK